MSTKSNRRFWTCLTFPHRNYMAIGDDDQTIYEWRGADPGYILSFAKRYGAAKVLSFTITSGPMPRRWRWQTK